MTEREPRKRRSVTQKDRAEAFDNTTKVAVQTLDDERRRRVEKTDRLRQARLEKDQQGDADDRTPIDT